MIGLSRLLLLGATTLAASRPGALDALPPPPLGEALCQGDTVAAHCRAADALVRPEHVLCPLLLPCLVQLFLHAPTVALASRLRSRQLGAAIAVVAAAWAALAACAYLHARWRPSLAYALALHSAACLLAMPGEPGLLLGPRADRLARVLASAALLLGAWHLGPPLPLLDAPRLSRCCGAYAHLLALLAPDAALAAVAGGARRLLSE